MNTRTKTAVERMANQAFPTDEEVRAAQPASMPARAAHTSDDTDQPSLEPAAPQRARVGQGSSRRRLLIAAGVGVVLAAGAVPVVTGLTGPTSYAATPPLLNYTPLPGNRSAADVLTELADRARKQPPLPGSGKYSYIHTRSWALTTGRTVGGKLLYSRIVPTDREEWIAPDGSGRIAATRNGERVSISGLYGPSQTESPTEFLASFPKETTADWFNFAWQLWRMQAVSPQRQSELLNNLANQPGIVLKGTTTDRAGRHGIAISTTTAEQEPKSRYIMVLDPNTGMLLSMEHIALTSGGLPINPPAPIEYTLWLETGHTDSVYERPHDD